MKLACPQAVLSANLSLVSRAVATRPSHPVMANVLLVANQDTQQLTLSAFDNSLGIQTTIAANVETGGKLTLPARLLTDIVSRLPEGDVTLDDGAEEDQQPTSYRTTITCSSGRYQVQGMSAEEFPELPTVPEGETLNMSVEALIEGLRGALFAASADETKQVLTGIHLLMDAEGLEFAATDGHRLSVVQPIAPEETEKPAKSSKKKGAASETQELDITIPAKALQELTKMLEKQGSNAVSVTLDRSQVIFDLTDQRLTSRLLEGQYPNYRQLVPRQFTHQATIERRSLQSALERIAVLADQKNNIVKVDVDSSKQQVSLSVDAPDVGSGEETIPAQVTGETLAIAFNVRYLLDGLKALNTTELQLQFNTATSPAILTPLGGTKMTYLIMPVQIRS
jgi:DNA polymerase III subunit beta